MNLQLIAKFSLLDENNKHILNVDIGKTIKDEDLQFSLEEQYLELKNKFANQTPEAITKRICADFGISYGEVVTTGIKLSRNFLGLTLYDIIQTAYTLASNKTNKKYQITFKGSKLNVLEKKVTDDTLVIEGGLNLLDATMTDSITNMINQVAIYNKNDVFL